MSTQPEFLRIKALCHREDMVLVYDIELPAGFLVSNGKIQSILGESLNRRVIEELVADAYREEIDDPDCPFEKTPDVQLLIPADTPLLVDWRS